MSLLLAAMMLAQGMSPERTNAIMTEAKGRIATIQKLLDAMARRDQTTFKALGGDKVAFSGDPELTFNALMAPRTPRLAIDSFASLASCKADAPRSTGVDWWTVAWACPVGGTARGAAYSFKFAGRNLVAVQASRRPPPVKIN